jgi:CRP-like cAMP-binding protein
VAEENRAQRVARAYPAGTVLFREGEEGATMFVLQSGKVKLVRERAGKEKPVAVLGPGDFFGELAILNGRPRASAAVVVEDARVLELDARTFGELLTKNPEVAVRLMKRLAIRLEQSTALVDVLVHRDPVLRVVLGLAHLAEHEGDGGEDGSIHLATSRADLTEKLGLGPEEIEPVLRRLFRLQLLDMTEDGFELPNVFRLQEFLAYLDEIAREGHAA